MFDYLARVVQRLDNAIHRINVNKTNHAIRWIVIDPVDSVILPLNRARGADFQVGGGANANAQA